MKPICTFVFLLLLCPLAKAQDIILKTDQTELSVRVAEITDDEVKFRYFKRLDGPIYTLKKSEVFVIIYQDGSREKFGPPAAKPNPIPVASTYPEKPAAPPSQPDPVPQRSTAASPTATEGNRSNFTGGLGYTSPVQGFGNVHGLTASAGYCFLGRSRKAGVLADYDALFYFVDASTQYQLLSVNGVFRTSDESKFYLGGGLGYSVVSVGYKDRFGVEKKLVSGDFGGKAFVGFSFLRVSVILPSFQGIESGGLFTAGIYANPFR